MISIDGFRLPTEDLVHVRYQAVPSKIETLSKSFGVPCNFIKAPGLRLCMDILLHRLHAV